MTQAPRLEQPRTSGGPGAAVDDPDAAPSRAADESPAAAPRPEPRVRGVDVRPRCRCPAYPFPHLRGAGLCRGAAEPAGVSFQDARDAEEAAGRAFGEANHAWIDACEAAGLPDPRTLDTPQEMFAAGVLAAGVTP